MRTVNVRLLKDGTGRVCIHWFVRDPQGKIKMPTGEAMSNLGPMQFGGAQGRIACNPNQNTVVPQHVGGNILLCCHSDDVRAVTCPDCQKTAEFIQQSDDLEHTLNTAQSAEGIKAMQSLKTPEMKR